MRNADEPDRHEGARYLSIALAAQREVARLQGLYYRIGREPAPAPMDIMVTRGPEGGAAPTDGTGDNVGDEARKQP